MVDATTGEVIEDSTELDQDVNDPIAIPVMERQYFLATLASSLRVEPEFDAKGFPNISDATRLTAKPIKQPSTLKSDPQNDLSSNPLC